MARRGQRTSYQQRIEIGERASAGESDREIGPVHGLLGLDGAQVARTYMRQDRAGLVSHMGRPAGGALTSCLDAVRERIAQLRRAHPGGGLGFILLVWRRRR